MPQGHSTSRIRMTKTHTSMNMKTMLLNNKKAINRQTHAHTNRHTEKKKKATRNAGET